MALQNQKNEIPPIFCWHGTEHPHPQGEAEYYLTPQIRLLFIENGSLTLNAHGQDTVLHKGDSLLYWCMVPVIAKAWHPKLFYHVAALPMDHLIGWRLPNLTGRLLAGELVQGPGDSLHDLAQFKRWGTYNWQQHPELTRIFLLEFEVRLRLLEIGLDATALQAPGPWSRSHPLNAGTLSKSEQMTVYISQHFQENIGAADVAKSVDLNTRYALAVFQNTLGTSMKKYIIQRRLAQAQQSLLTTDDKILDIALAAGFGSERRFYSTFKQFCQTSPRQYRLSAGRATRSRH
jgi:AraC-like DNA-binding protein